MTLLDGDPGTDREHCGREDRPALRPGSAEQGGRGAPAGHAAGRPGGRCGRALGEQASEDREWDERADRVAELRPGAEDQPANGGGRGAELGGDLAVADALELPLDQGLALRIGKGAHRHHEPIEFIPLLGEVARVRMGGEGFIELVDPGFAADRVQGTVADDGEEPWPKVDFAGIVEQGGMGLGERCLHDVLGAVGGDDRGREADQRPAVPADDLLERGVVTLPDELDQPLVRLRGECSTRNRFQGLEIRHFSSIIVHLPAGL